MTNDEKLIEAMARAIATLDKEHDWQYYKPEAYVALTAYRNATQDDGK